MNESIIKDVMEDVLEELKEANRSLGGLRSSVDALEGRVAGFEQMLKHQQVIIQPPDLDSAFEEIRQLTGETGVAVSETIETVRREAREMLEQARVSVERGLGMINDRLAEHPKSVIRQWRVSLFPEYDRQGSYKYFISWLFGGTVLALLVGTLFSLGRQYLDKWQPPPDKPVQGMSMTDVKAANAVKAPAPSVVRRQGSTGFGRSIPLGRERTKKIEKIIDSLHNILIQYLPDSMRENGVKQPRKEGRNVVMPDSFSVIK